MHSSCKAILIIRSEVNKQDEYKLKIFASKAIKLNELSDLLSRQIILKDHIINIETQKP